MLIVNTATAMTRRGLLSLCMSVVVVAAWNAKPFARLIQSFTKRGNFGLKVSTSIDRDTPITNEKPDKRIREALDVRIDDVWLVFKKIICRHDL